MFRCVFILRDGASLKDAKALGVALYRLRLEVSLRKRASSKRGIRSCRRSSPVTKKLLGGCLGKQTAMSFDMRMSGWPKDLYPVGMDANTKHVNILRDSRPPPPVCRLEMIHILRQYLPMDVLEDVLVDGESWSEL